MSNIPDHYWLICSLCLCLLAFYIIKNAVEATKALKDGMPFYPYLAGEVLAVFVISFTPYLNLLMLIIWAVSVSWNTIIKAGKFIRKVFYLPLIERRQRKR